MWNAGVPDGKRGETENEYRLCFAAIRIRADVSSFNRGEPFPFNLKCRLNSPRFDPTNTRDHYIIYAIIVSKECEISDGAQLNNDQKR